MSILFAPENSFGDFSIFSGGTSTSPYLTITDRYLFGALVAIPGTSLLVARRSLSACGDYSRAIIGGGYNSSYLTTTDKYTYLTNVVVAGTVLGAARSALAAAGNVTQGIFSGGEAL